MLIWTIFEKRKIAKIRVINLLILMEGFPGFFRSAALLIKAINHCLEGFHLMEIIIRGNASLICFRGEIWVVSGSFA